MVCMWDVLAGYSGSLVVLFGTLESFELLGGGASGGSGKQAWSNVLFALCLLMPMWSACFTLLTTCIPHHGFPAMPFHSWKTPVA